MLYRYGFITASIFLLVGCEQKPKVNSYIVPKEESKAVVPVTPPPGNQDSTNDTKNSE